MKDKIKKMLFESFVFTESQKQKILESLKTLSEKKLKQLFNLVSYVDKQQDEILKNALKKNKNLFQNLKSFALRKSLEKKETESLKKDECTLNILEKAFPNF